MKQSRSYWLTIAGFVLALPAAIFICFSLLKFNWSVDGPYDAISPILEDTGISEPPGWNVNLLILLGPIVGFLCVLSQLLKFDWKKLGIDPAKAKITAPEINNFQQARTFKSGDTIPVAKNKGWLLIVQ